MNIPMPRDASEIINAYLGPGERLLWAGRPKQGFALRGWDIVHWPLSLFACVAGTILTIHEWREPGNVGVLIFVILWTIATYYAAFGRFFVDRWQRSLTYYAVTDRRAIILTRAGPDHIQSVYLNILKEVTYTRRSDGTGTLEFDRPGYSTIQGRWDMWRGATFPWDNLTPAFEMITGAREVRDLIVQAQQHASQTS